MKRSKSIIMAVLVAFACAALNAEINIDFSGVGQNISDGAKNFGNDIRSLRDRLLPDSKTPEELSSENKEVFTCTTAEDMDKNALLILDELIPLTRNGYRKYFFKNKNMEPRIFFDDFDPYHGNGKERATEKANEGARTLCSEKDKTVCVVLDKKALKGDKDKVTKMFIHQLAHIYNYIMNNNDSNHNESFDYGKELVELRIKDKGFSIPE